MDSELFISNEKNEYAQPIWYLITTRGSMDNPPCLCYIKNVKKKKHMLRKVIALNFAQIKNYHKGGRRRKEMYLLAILVFLAVIVLTVGLNCGLAGVSMSIFVDIPSLLIVLLIVIPILLGAGVWKDVISAFRMLLTRKWDVTLYELRCAEHGLKVLMASLLAAGSFGTVCSLLAVLGYVPQSGGMEMEAICANLEVASIPFFYSLLFLLLLIPLKALVKRHILDFMERDL